MMTDEATTRTSGDLRWLLITALYGTASFSGVVQAISENGLVHYLIALLLATFAAGWCVADARQRGTPLLPVLQMLAFLFWPVAVPLYLVASRKWRGLAYIVLNAVGLSTVILISLFTMECFFYG